MSVTVRQAKPAEAAVVAELVREGFRSEAERYGVEIPPMREVADDVVAAFDSGEIVMIAEIDDRPVGTVRGERIDAKAVMVRRLAVLPDARRNGVARALMLALEKAYRRRGIERFELFTGCDTTPAIALYESLGYAHTRDEEVHPGVRLVYLEKVVG